MVDQIFLRDEVKKKQYKVKTLKPTENDKYFPSS